MPLSSRAHATTSPASHATTGTPMNQYNFETELLVREELRRFAQTMAQVRCAEARTIDGHPCEDVRSYYVRLGLGVIPDVERRRRLQLTPTSLTLPKRPASTCCSTNPAKCSPRATLVFLLLIRGLRSVTNR